MTKKILWIFFAIMSIGFIACSKDDESSDIQYPELVGYSFEYKWNSSKNRSYIIKFKDDSTFNMYTLNNDDKTIFNDVIFDGSYVAEVNENNISLTFSGVNGKWDGDKYFTIVNGSYNKENQMLNIYLQYSYPSGKKKSFTRTFTKIK